MTAKKMYPECEKVRAVRDKSQAIGDFLTWLRHEKGVILCRHVEDRNYPQPFSYNINSLLAEFFDIDREKVEAEKQDILTTMREMNERRERCEAAMKRNGFEGKYTGGQD